MSGKNSGKAKPRPKPTPMVHNGQPPNGKHVPSAVPGHPGPFDYSGAVGSNVTSVPGPDLESGQVLSAPPWQAAYPTPGLEQAPMY
ncbi:MAG: hypothetical protein ACRDRN_10360 [Sciscionella sp.]